MHKFEIEVTLMKKQMVRLLALTLFAISVCWCCSANAQKVESATIAPVETDYSLIASGLEQSGLMYRKVRPNFWEILYKKSEKAPEQSILISADNNVVISLLVVGQLAEKPPADMYKKIAELNNKYYFIKFVYDKQNLYLRIDTLLKSMNGEMVADIVNRLTVAVEKEGDILSAFVQNPNVAPEKKQPGK
jgi:hypothetical protein